jgi:hypothetical protein
MSGIELQKRLRCQQPSPNHFHHRHGDASLRDLAMKAGAAGFENPYGATPAKEIHAALENTARDGHQMNVARK